MLPPLGTAEGESPPETALAPAELPLPHLDLPLQPPPTTGSVPGTRRGRGGAHPVPMLSPQAWADEALRRIQLRQGVVTETWAQAVDLLARQVESESSRLIRASAHLAAELEEATGALEGSLAGLREETAAQLETLRQDLEAQTTTLRGTAQEQARVIAASTREASSHIGVARHELALSSAELRRAALRHGVLLGGATAVLILFLARLLFPFWGMGRADVEAWTRGTRLLETYRRAPEGQRRAILRVLGWEGMPGAAPPPALPSTSSVSREGGR